MRNLSPVCAVVLVSVLFAGCKSTYYAAWEKLGWEKRDILSSRVVEARDAQQQAGEQFKTTLVRFKELTQFKGGDLEAMYNKLDSQYRTCESRAVLVTDRIKAVKSVANDMFAEWKEELKQYQSNDLRSKSQRKLDETQARYGVVIAAMHKSESRMQPILGQFHDQVLFLKHNLDASAVSSLQGTSATIETDVNQLIAEMQASIDESNAFIGQLK